MIHLRRLPMLFSIIGCAALVIGVAADPRRVAFAYLDAYIQILSLSLGALAVMMVCDACGAVWLVALRRCAEVCTAPLPALAVLFLPLLPAMPLLYPWAGNLPLSAHDHRLVVHRHPYLQAVGFTGRAVSYLLIWTVMSECMRHWSLSQEHRSGQDLSHRRRALASAGLLPLAFTVTFAGFDWLMSLDPEWYSTAFGVYLLSGAFTAGTALITLIFLVNRRKGLFPPGFGAEHRHALGKLLITAIVFWAYIAFMQFLVVWMADLPDESGWYVVRMHGTWGDMGMALIFGGFAIPFLLLLPRSAKRSTPILATAAVIALMAHAMDLYWLIMPAYAPGRIPFHWTDAAALAAIGGIAWTVALWRTRGVPFLPAGDSDLPASIAYRSRP